ncbi:alpha/beta fold hydrolase [Methylocystis sp. MJC1]|uniref:alpha/beta hydrolase n=1 Tax=Methylocystis sp. MJC1 TaxID=2654282 RepID=UPI0013EDEAD1|nr:alpha/beta fold hydrolase [Methylocystis sp. MJC1]KAF2989958.1 Multifunctional-autoprocessing repeats-in-toxin [Methylocystis sp. MJC1]MBU6528833.1 alpha/beta fold hydrolase [Methylocystis sp. MJC1]UZX11719.1 alpha/beta fold hydrolase [Methylocystis sp. MJC1]
MKWLKITLASVTTIYLLSFTGLAVQQRAMIYPRHALLVTPVQAGLSDVETLRLKTEDGETLEAWHRAPKDARFPLILYFQGNAGPLADRKKRFDTLTRHGYGLLAISWRGYGGSTGEPSEAGLMRDAEAAYTEALNRGFKPERIVVMGESLGTGVATMLAARHGAAALVLDSPYDSVLAVAQSRFPIFPVSLVLEDTFRADEAIGKVRAPVLMIVGENDAITPAANARRLFERAGEPKRLMALPGVSHLALSSPGALEKTMDWIDAAVTASPARDPAQ